MAKDLDAILGSTALAGLVESIKPGLPVGLPAGFYTVSKETTDPSGAVQYDYVEGTKQLATLVRYNGKSAARNTSGIDTRIVKAMFSAEHLPINPTQLLNLRQPGSNTVEAIARREVDRRVAEARQLQQNLRNTAVHATLLDGILYFDSVGNLLPNSTGSQYNIDWSVPASNQNQLTDISGSGIITASWATAGTDIIGNINTIKTTAILRTGYELTTAVYGSAILGYLLGNTAASTLMQSNSMLTTDISNSGEIPNGFMGLNWVRGDRFFFRDSGATARLMVASDEVIYLPDPDPSWYDFVQTPYLYTQNEGLSEGGQIGDIVTQIGPSMQAKVTSDPVAAEIIYRDAFLPVLNVPSAIYISDVVP